jgi:RNA polymerase sigma-70 factor (ECF subfamily)
LDALAAWGLDGRAAEQRVLGLPRERLYAHAVESGVEEGPYVASVDDTRLVASLREGDERAFMELVERYGPAMLRVAMLFVRTRAVAEEVVQDTWVGVLDGIGRFEGRSSFKTWLFRILTNTAKTRGERESRSTPVAFLSGSDLELGAPSVDPDRFLPDGERWAGWWASSPMRFDEQPESRLLSSETLGIVRQVVEELPEAQKAVIAMRDLAGWSSEEVCESLGISEGNQRVLLHRARTKVRAALEEHLGQTTE